MRFLITAALVLSCSLCWAEDAPKEVRIELPIKIDVQNIDLENNTETLRDALQGTWRRPNIAEFVVIEGDTYAMFDEDRPFTPVRSGTLTFDDENGIATVVCKGDVYTCYFWNCGVWPKTGQRVIANEIFKRGRVWDHGQILYRTDTEKDGNE